MYVVYVVCVVYVVYVVYVVFVVCSLTCYDHIVIVLDLIKT